MVSPLGLDDFDGELGAVRLGEVGLVLESRRHRAVPLLARVAVFVELEQLRRQRLAAVVTLALVAIDAHFESAGIGHAGILLVVLCLGPFVGPYVNVSLAEGWPASKTGSGAAEKPADYNMVAGNRGRIGGRDWAPGSRAHPSSSSRACPSATRLFSATNHLAT